MKKTKKTVTKKKLVTKIYCRFGQALNQRIIQDAVNIICVALQTDLLQDRAVSVENFGTLSPYSFHRHSGLNLATGQIEEIKSFRTVKFRPHLTLLEFLAQRRERFLDTKSTGRASKKG